MKTLEHASRGFRHALPALVSLVFAILPGPSWAAAGPSRAADDVRAYNSRALEAQAASRRGAAADLEARDVLARRAVALRRLMQDDPAAAERLAFPASVLDSLAESFPASRSHLEQRGRWSGELEYLIEDGLDLATHREVLRLHRAKEVLDVRFAGRTLPGLRSGLKVALGGVRLGTALVAAEVELVDASMDGSTLATGDSVAGTCGPGGGQGVVAILVNLPDYKLPASATADFVRGVLLGNAWAGTAQSATDWSVDDFWRQNSDGRTYVDANRTTVVGPVTLSGNFNTNSSGAAYCDYPALGAAAMKEVDGQVDFRRYSRVKIVMPGNGACSWAGVANVGCRTLSTSGDGSFPASMAWQMAGSMGTRAKAVQLTTHELGHNLGMSHASSRDFGAEPLGSIGASGTLSEYGDVHSTMGSWNFGFYAASHAANQLGWLASGANYQVVETSGTYTIQNYEARPAGSKALKVRRGTGTDGWLWIESRQNTGIYSSRLDPSVHAGALIRYQDASTGNRSHLLDFTPGTTSFADAALLAGQAWTDPYSNVSVFVNSVTAGAMTVTVNYGALPCVPAAPEVALAPAGVATEFGAAASFTVTVRSTSSSGCPAETYALDATVPSGWTRSLSLASLALAPGQSGQARLTVGVPAPYALGTYPVTGGATSATTTKRGSASQSVTVVEPTHRLSIVASGGGTVLVSTPAQSCSGTCAIDYPATATTTVTLQAVASSRNVFKGWSGACSGTATTCTLAVGSDLSASANFGKASGGGKRTR
jgi:M6 family metalloprotease-like protein